MLIIVTINVLTRVSSLVPIIMILVFGLIFKVDKRTSSVGVPGKKISLNIIIDLSKFFQFLGQMVKIRSQNNVSVQSYLILKLVIYNIIYKSFLIARENSIIPDGPESLKRVTFTKTSVVRSLTQCHKPAAIIHSVIKN